MTAGIALTGGIAAADMAIGVRSALKSGKVWHHNLADHAKEGLLYGSVLGATEPAIAHGLMKKPVDQNG